MNKRIILNPTITLKLILTSLIFIFLNCKNDNDRPLYIASKTMKEPVMDGEIDSVWSTANLAFIKNIKKGNEYIKDSFDLSASFKMIWSSENLFILFEVYDDHLYNLNELKYRKVDAPKPWHCDGVELFFDVTNKKSKYFDPKQGDFKYEIVYSDSILTSQYSSLSKGINFVFKNNPTGYNLEVKIPFTTLGIIPKKDLIIGFETAVNDNDNDPKKGIFIIQRAFLMWAEKSLMSDAWRNTSVYGNVKLTE